MNVRLLSPSEEEYAEAMLFYLEESPVAADGFIEEVEEAIADIGNDPMRPPIYEADIRMKLLDRYPYTIYYRVKNDEALVVSICHQARRPKYWIDRTR